MDASPPTPPPQSTTPPAGAPAPPGPKSAWSTLSGLAIEAIPAIAGAIGFVGFIALIGGAIQWTRFWAADLPADQAVRVMPESELVAVGAVSTILFSLFGLAAVLLVYFLDSRGQASSRTRLGLFILVAAEFVATGLVIELQWYEYLLLALWAVALVALGYRPLEAALRTFGPRLGRRSRGLEARENYEAAHERHLEAWDAWQVAGQSERPVEEIAEARAALARAEDAERVALLRWERAQGSDPDDWDEEDPHTGASYTPMPRSVLPRELVKAPTTIELVLFGFVLAVGVAVFWAYEETRWLVRIFPVPLLLFLILLGIARATKRFAWYGVAVFLSVPLFGGVLAVADILRTPEVQPIALVRKTDDRALCGVYITQTEDRMYVGRVEPKEGSDTTQNETGRIFSIPMSDIDLASVGPLQPVRMAERHAIQLLDEVYADRAEQAPPEVKNVVTSEVEEQGDQTTTTTTEEPVAAGRPVRREAPKDHPPEGCASADLD